MSGAITKKMDVSANPQKTTHNTKQAMPHVPQSQPPHLQNPYSWYTDPHACFYDSPKHMHAAMQTLRKSLRDEKIAHSKTKNQVKMLERKMKYRDQHEQNITNQRNELEAKFKLGETSQLNNQQRYSEISKYNS